MMNTLTDDDRADLLDTRALQVAILDGPDNEAKDVLRGHRYARTRIAEVDRMLSAGSWTP